MDEFKRVSNREMGIGGMKCPCCGLIRADRPRLRRRSRRRLRQQLERILNYATGHDAIQLGYDDLPYLRGN